jgi:hypothetical protein
VKVKTDDKKVLDKIETLIKSNEKKLNPNEGQLEMDLSSQKGYLKG